MKQQKASVFFTDEDVEGIEQRDSKIHAHRGMARIETELFREIE